MLVRRLSRARVFLLCAFLLLVSPSPSARASASPRVLAFYYAWYDQNTWTPSLVSDLPAQTYNSSDPASMARQIGQAQNAGIDAFVVSWIGTNNPTDSNFRTLLGLARSSNFEATIDLEVEHFATPGQVVSALGYVRDNLMSQPAFLRDNGRPVLFFWREQSFSVGDWANIRAQIDPNHQQIWIAEGTDITYQQVFDGHHLYSIAWSPNVSSTLQDWAGRVRRAGAGKLWVATVMPGYDDTRTTRTDRFARARDNGNFYGATWQAAIGSNPDLIIINSFNEWVEGTMIEPSVSYGNRYLDLTRQFAAQFKSGAPAVAVSSIPPAVSPTPPSTLKPDQRLTADILHVRGGPGLVYSVLGTLRANRIITILGRSADAQWLQIAYPDSDHPGWVSAEYVTPQAGLDEFPVPESLPASTETSAGAPLPADASRTPVPSASEDELFYNLQPWY